MQSRFFLFTFTVLLLLIKVCPALSQDISFNKVSLPDETLLQDSLPALHRTWKEIYGLALSGSGLYRFDGVHLKSYIHDPLNPASLADNSGVCICRQGWKYLGRYLWFGLEKFDTENRSFYTLQTQ